MPWQRMRFKDQIVWVNTNDSGGIMLDSDGRAEMKYHEQDKKAYRPAAQNLLPLKPGEDVEEPPPRRKSSANIGKDTSGPSYTAHLLGKPLANAVQIWTDGACTGNPGPMGIGMVVITPRKRLERGEYLGLGTNNIAELTAIARGIEMAMSLGLDPQTPLAVHTDSAYAIGVLGQGWKAKANTEVIAQLRSSLASHPNLRFVKVEAHAGIYDNERCDELARMAITQRARV